MISLSLAFVVAYLCPFTERRENTMKHWHRCGMDNVRATNDAYDGAVGCGHYWQHERPALNTTTAQFHDAHTCPKCGRGPWLLKADGPDAVTSVFRALQEAIGQ